MRVCGSSLSSAYPTIYLLLGMNAISRAAMAQMTYVRAADVNMMRGVGMPQDLTHANTGMSTNMCIRYMP